MGSTLFPAVTLKRALETNEAAAKAVPKQWPDAAVRSAPPGAAQIEASRRPQKQQTPSVTATAATKEHSNRHQHNETLQVQMLDEPPAKKRYTSYVSDVRNLL